MSNYQRGIFDARSITLKLRCGKKNSNELRLWGWAASSATVCGSRCSEHSTELVFLCSWETCIFNGIFSGIFNGFIFFQGSFGNDSCRILASRWAKVAICRGGIWRSHLLDSPSGGDPGWSLDLWIPHWPSSFHSVHTDPVNARHMRGLNT